MTHRLRHSFALWGGAAALAVCAALPVCAAGPVAAPTLRIDAQTSACEGVRVAASDAAHVALGWTIGTGPRAGVYFRLRREQLWEPTIALSVSGATTSTAFTTSTLTSTSGRAPRDLDLEWDARGRLHAVWTAIGTQGAKSPRPGRVVMHAVVPLDGSLASAAPLLKGFDTTAQNFDVMDADFPTMAPLPEGGVAVVWQEARELGYAVRCAMIPPSSSQPNTTSEASDLGTISPPTTAGMAPQVLFTNPLSVAWYEVGADGGALRVSEWKPDAHAWAASPWQAAARAFPTTGQPLLRALPEGIAATWEDASPGDAALKLGWLPARAAAWLAYGAQPAWLGTSTSVNVTTTTSAATSSSATLLRAPAKFENITATFNTQPVAASPYSQSNSSAEIVDRFGPSETAVDSKPARIDSIRTTLTVQSFAARSGELGRPTLSGLSTSAITLVWPALLTGGGHSIEVGREQLGNPAPEQLILPPQATQRHAALPDHVTLGSWTAVAWIDDARDGGDGGVYFSEIQWPN